MFCRKNKKKQVWSLLFLLIFLPFSSQAALQSESYVIFENIHHTFDGPVISNVASSVSGLQATVTWNTNVDSDSFVLYNTDPAMPADTNKEQGASIKNKTSHSVTLSRLSPNTTYYYKAKSTRVNGGTSIYNTVGSFSIGADPDAVIVEPPAPPSSAGGGVLIIDKTDKNAPVISDLNAEVIDSKSVRITWKTNEDATSFVEYGETLSFGKVFGDWSSSTDHSVLLEDLKPGKSYNYRALSSDSWGNLAKSDTLSFVLKEEAEEKEEGEEDVEEEPIPEEEIIEEEPDILDEVKQSALELLRKLFPEVALNEITEDDLKGVGNLNQLSEFIDAPVLSGLPKIEVGDTEATISWVTDIDSNSMIAFAPEDHFNPDSNEPYYQIVGNAEEMVKSHEVKIHNLTPDTTYHFQLRSKPRIGPTALSRDYTFATNLETLTIVSFFSQVENSQEAVFRWVTNKEADSQVKYSPYHNNVVAIDEQKIVKDNNSSVIHEIRISEFEAGIFYDVELMSTDSEGNSVSETLFHFSTSEDDLPPEISHVKADSTVFLDQSNKTQTVISWLTNEPATSKVYFQEGVHGELKEGAEAIALNENYTKEHVIVITKFKPGIVYSFRVESIDSGGSVSLSKVHTFMTAKQRESIIQIIIRIFEDTFGWAKKLM